MCMTKPSIIPISLYQSLKLKGFFKMFLKKRKINSGRLLCFQSVNLS